MAGEMREDILKVLYTEEEIQARVKELGARITQEYAGKQPFFLGVLKGCYVFMADLLRAVDLPCDMDFMAVSTYVGTQRVKQPQIDRDVKRDLAGRDIVIVEDILDSGMTLNYLRNYLLHTRKAASVHIVTLLDKPEGRAEELKGIVEADHYCFRVPNEFVVGYGLDYDERYRNLPYIGVLKPEVYTH